MAGVVLEMNLLVRNRCRDELDCYIKMPKQELRNKVTDEDGNEKVVFNNPLECWKSNQKIISTLAGLASMYLAIQATSAPTEERVFSLASRVISKFQQVWILKWQECCSVWLKTLSGMKRR
jgi:hypothetical protein